MTKLTREDWIEIYYALDSKLQLVRGWAENEKGLPDGERAYLMSEDEPHPHACDDKAWAEHLESIMEKLGPDGEHMIAPSTPDARTFTVVLLYPDYMNDSGTETYICDVEAPDRERAITLAQEKASQAQGDDPPEPDDFAPLAVFLGPTHLE